MARRGSEDTFRCQRLEARTEWKVEDYFSPSAAERDGYDSPDIEFAGSTFKLRLYPNTKLDYVGLALVLKKQSSPIKVGYTLGIKTSAGDTEVRDSGTSEFSPRNDRVYSIYIDRCDLWNRRRHLAPDDILTIWLSLKTDVLGPDIGTTEVGVQTSVEDAGDQAANGGREALENTGTTDVAVQTCPEDVIDQDGNGDHQTLEKTDFATFCRNIEELEGKDSDVTLEVRGMNFRAHRFILEVRNPALAEMFFDNASEAENGVVCVEDCLPEAFEVFLRFVYSGVAENLTSENVTGVYYVANKYDVPRLKKECVRHMLSNLTIGSVCSVIDVAHWHGEDLLQETASEFFVENAREIFRMPSWRKFMAKNNNLANDLIIRGYEKSK